MLNYRRVSKLLSLMLRHRSDEFGLSMDQYGFVPVAEVGEAVHDRHDDLGEEDVRNLVADPGQHRFEIVDDRIRALYGHSFFIEMDGEPAEPPERLYLWCSAAEARRFRAGGVVPVDRSYVHFSLSRDAAEARSRRVDAPCVVEVLAREAHTAGVAFYLRGEVILTTEVPVDFVGEISGLEGAPSGASASRPGADDRQPTEPPAFGRRMRRATRYP